MTKDEVIRDLNAIGPGDREAAHEDADDLILKFLETNGFEDVAEAWHELTPSSRISRQQRTRDRAVADYQWCFDHPHEAAAEIDRLRDEIEWLREDLKFARGASRNPDDVDALREAEALLREWMDDCCPWTQTELWLARRSET